MAGARIDPVPVMFVSSHAHKGGSERYLELLLGSLEPGWIGGIVSLQDGPFVQRLRELGHDVEVVPTGPRLDMLASAVRLRRVLARRRPGVVHANGVKAAAVAALATAGTRLPVIWLKHDFSWDGPLARLVAAGCRQVVAVSAAVTTTFGARLRRRVRVVPNGLPDYEVDREAGRALVARLLDAPAEAPMGVLVGRLHPAKGQIELIEALPRVLDRRPDARCALVGGDDPYQAAYAETVRRRAGELGLESAVTFLGHRDDALTLVSGCDVAVTPSVADERGFGKESFSFAVVEALAVGTPVVAYADGALPEVLGECAELVPPGDRVALAESIVRVLEDEDLRGRLVECGSARVRERYRLSSMVESMKRCYRETARP